MKNRQLAEKPKGLTYNAIKAPKRYAYKGVTQR